MSEFYSDESSAYSSSDNDDYYCYYCETDLDYEDNVFEDVEPCKPRYYCSSCKLHIHTDDLQSD